MTKRWHKLAALPIAFALVAAACGGDDDGAADAPDEPDTTEAPDTDEPDAPDAPDTEDFGGVEIVITGSERDDPSVGAINAVLQEFGSERGIDVTFIGDADWEANINTQVEGGNPPDISIFPQPGKLAEFARDGFILPLSDDVVASIQEHWAESYQLDGIVDDVHYGVPVKTDLKSLVWYKPSIFEGSGYSVPETFEELEALTQEMVDAGGAAPWCVGVESGQATGWTYTDWVEEMVLRLHGGDVYDGWVSNEIPFDDPRIIEAMLAPITLWTGESDEEAARQALADRDLPRVFAASGTIAQTNFADSADPLIDGQCYMHRQASFFSGFFPPDTPFADGSDDAINVFYFPDINDDAPALTAGTLAAAFNDEPATMAVLEFMATGEYAEKRQAEQTRLLDGGLSGFLSAASGQDPSVYQPLEQEFLDILLNAELARFDASDLMPAAVGAGSFWSEGTNIINGDITVSEGAARIQESWPN